MRRSTSPSLLRGSATVGKSGEWKQSTSPAYSTTRTAATSRVVVTRTSTSNEFRSLERDDEIEQLDYRSHASGQPFTSPESSRTTSAAPPFQQTFSPPPLGAGVMQLPTRALGGGPSRSSTTKSIRSTTGQQIDINASLVDAEGEEDKVLPLHGDSGNDQAGPSPTTFGEWKSRRDAVRSSVSYGRLLSLRYYLRWYSYWWLKAHGAKMDDIRDVSTQPDVRDATDALTTNPQEARPSTPGRRTHYPPPPPLPPTREIVLTEKKPDDGSIDISPSVPTTATPIDELPHPSSPTEVTHRHHHRNSFRQQQRDRMLKEMVDLMGAVLPHVVVVVDDGRDAVAAKRTGKDTARANRAEAQVDELLTRRREQLLRGHGACRVVTEPKSGGGTPSVVPRSSPHGRSTGPPRTPSARKRGNPMEDGGGYFVDVPRPTPLYSLNYLPSTVAAATQPRAASPAVPPPEPFRLTVPKGPDLRVSKRAESRLRGCTWEAVMGDRRRPASAPSRAAPRSGSAGRVVLTANGPPQQRRLTTQNREEASWWTAAKERGGDRRDAERCHDPHGLERYVLVARRGAGGIQTQTSHTFDQAYHRTAELRKVLAGIREDGDDCPHPPPTPRGTVRYQQPPCADNPQQDANTVSHSKLERSGRHKPEHRDRDAADSRSTHNSSTVRHNLRTRTVPTTPVEEEADETSANRVPTTPKPPTSPARRQQRGGGDTDVRHNADADVPIQWAHKGSHAAVGVVNVGQRKHPTPPKEVPVADRAHSGHVLGVGLSAKAAAMKEALKELVREARQRRRDEKQRKGGTNPAPTLSRATVRAGSESHHVVRSSSPQQAVGSYAESRPREKRRGTDVARPQDETTGQCVKTGVATAYHVEYLKDLHRSERAAKKSVKDLLWRQAPARRVRGEWDQYLQEVLPAASDAIQTHRERSAEAIRCQFQAEAPRAR